MIKAMIKRFLLLVPVTATLMAAGGCTPMTAQRGNLLEAEQIADVKVGESSRSDVLRSIGSPTTVSPFDENIWYYIGQETEKRGILDPEVVNEQILLVAFDEKGIVTRKENIDEGRIDIPLERESTPTHGQKNTILQQMLGNIGRFNPQVEE